MVDEKLRAAVGGFLAAPRLRDAEYRTGKSYPQDAELLKVVSPVMSQDDMHAAKEAFISELARVFELATRLGPNPSDEERVRFIGSTLKGRAERPANSFPEYTQEQHLDYLQERKTDNISALVARARAGLPASGPVASVTEKPQFRSVGSFAYDAAALRTCAATIRQGTGGRFPDAVAMINHINAAETCIEELRTRPSQDSGQQNEHTYRAVQKTARDVFGSACADKLEANDLNFTVTVFEWSSRHPKVPAVLPLYTFKKEDLLEILWSVENGDNIAMIGPTGCGKTVGTEQVAAKLGRPFFRIPIDGNMRPRALLGGFTQVATNGASSTVWQKGVLEQAMELPSIISIDEFDRADPDLLYTMHQLLEGKGLVILDDGNRTVMPHPNLAIMATANTKGRADSLNLYQLQQEMSEATRDRISTWLECDYRSEEEDTTFLRTAYPDLNDDTTRIIATVATAMRESFKAGTLRTACSHRTLETCARNALFLQKALLDPVEARVRAIRSKIVSRGGDAEEVNAMGSIAEKVIGDAWDRYSPAPKTVIAAGQTS
ncbi:MAG: hypothetical protein DI537_05415 [Stutzerimonas stutzeri]|nr:MAG: hypothetical protein DI537_05415 [Stutzerimonas stutzeri]